MGHPNATRLNTLDDAERVRLAIPDGVDAVVDTLIRVELEIDPIMCEKDTRRWLRDRVADWLFDRRGRGASSSAWRGGELALGVA
jgi:hypothetical protein